MYSKSVQIILGLFIMSSILKADEIYIYTGQGVDNNLREMPADILKVSLPYEKSYMLAVGGFIPIKHLWTNVLLGASGLVVWHYGIQNHIETDVAYTLKYQHFLPSNSFIQADYAMGMGLSYAFDTPVYEDTASNGKYYRLQAFLHFDIEMYMPSSPSIAILTRVHHRSGIYGIIAPQNVGSNFVTVGLSYHF